MAQHRARKQLESRPVTVNVVLLDDLRSIEWGHRARNECEPHSISMWLVVAHDGTELNLEFSFGNLDASSRKGGREKAGGLVSGTASEDTGGIRSGLTMSAPPESVDGCVPLTSSSLGDTSWPCLWSTNL